MDSNPCRGLLYKDLLTAVDIIVPQHAHQLFTHSRGTSVNGPANKAQRGSKIKKKDNKVLKADRL